MKARPLYLSMDYLPVHKIILSLHRNLHMKLVAFIERQETLKISTAHTTQSCTALDWNKISVELSQYCITVQILVTFVPS